MLSELTIKNFGLIDSISLDLSGGMNVFTGETGAGKTIVIDALRFALGGKISGSEIRDTSSQSIVEAVFELTKDYTRGYEPFNDLITDDDTSLIIKRVHNPDGKNNIKVNGFTLTMKQLRELGDQLVDFHGPNDHQMLLSQHLHISILDRLADVDLMLMEYKSIFSEYSGLLSKKKKLEETADTKEREIEFLSHQIKELEEISLKEEDYIKVVEEQKRLSNAETLAQEVSKLMDILEMGDQGVSNAVAEAFGPMEKLCNLDESTTHMMEFLENIQINTSDLMSKLTEYAESLSFDPNEAEKINNDYDIYYEILRKYGPDISNAASFYSEIQEKYSLMVDIEHNFREIEVKIKAAKSKLNGSAKRLNAERVKTGIQLKKTIEKELTELGIKHVQFECRIEKTDPNKNGTDIITFYISPNAGEPLKPLADIVSSGEAARLMLALKKALVMVDPIPVLIFDEIDSQIGGRLGTVTGKKLRELSNHRQVILITHLPQIASFGDKHFKVLKRVEKKRTLTSVTDITDTTRVAELAKMMSGEKESDISIKHAEDMLVKARMR